MFKPALPRTFVGKKASILADLSIPAAEYTDKSPKGTVDVQIAGLIRQINAVDGLVTTSSCAGRVAVFVEGEKRQHQQKQSDGDVVAGDEETEEGEGEKQIRTGKGPGGKGGGRWLFVSHERVEMQRPVDGGDDGPPPQRQQGHGRFTTLFGLAGTDDDDAAAGAAGVVLDDESASTAGRGLRLVRLSFAPLILHVLCASLQHARPLLSAAINAGFRESGVQSLKVLEDPEAAVMVAIRTAGLAFETVVGMVKTDDGGKEVVECCVGEDYLALCVAVINERFAWNDERRDRFTKELERALATETKLGDWEDAESRRMRKREEGLRKQKLKIQQQHDVDGSEKRDAELEGLIFGIN